MSKKIIIDKTNQIPINFSVPAEKSVGYAN